MYAALFKTSSDSSLQLLERVALEFSPSVEVFDEDTVVLPVEPLRKLLGPPHQIASAIGNYGYEQKLQANLALASNPDAAILLAQNLPGVTLVTPGQDGEKLAPLSMERLFTHGHSFTMSSESQLSYDIFRKWGLKTCGDIAALSRSAISERLGPEGVYLQTLAAGLVSRPLRLASTSVTYEQSMDLEHALTLLEPLLFLIGSALRDLCARLKAQSQAARLVQLDLKLDGDATAKEFQCRLELPIPLAQPQALLKLLQLDLERHGPQAPVLGFHLFLQPDTPKRTQGNFFVPQGPQPDQLQVTLERIRGIVGRENVGCPQLQNTFRPDAFKTHALEWDSEATRAETRAQFSSGAVSPDQASSSPACLRIGIRIFRPALPARVTVHQFLPCAISAQTVRGKVVQAAGPWKTSGEWWSATAWSHVEWDVALHTGGLYRIYQEDHTSRWYVFGMYD